MSENELPVYPARDDWESRIYDKHNMLVAVVVGDDHWERACLIAHLINEHYQTEPNVFYPKPQPNK